MADRIAIENLDQFTLELSSFAGLVPEQTATLQKKIVFDLLGKIVKRTPVGNPDLWRGPAPAGYVGGRARANWQVDVNVEPGNDELDFGNSFPGEGATIGAGEARALMAQPFSITWIYNNVPYIVRLEEGWSSQANPGEIVRLSIEEARAIEGE